tara:strand:+ start:517 stop:717 length:201 start_codon:yes stop_codon:yes gene_type:complete
VDKTKMANKVWEKIKRNWRALPSYFSDKEPYICGICGNITGEERRNKEGKAVRQTTEEYCKENCEV